MLNSRILYSLELVLGWRTYGRFPIHALTLITLKKIQTKEL